jgi:alkanesulfonate monooxygenase SsuD/methylene tetrahydromethanopterin reductase-like flavin-dependent oxidoreductase (luciferase family)
MDKQVEAPAAEGWPDATDVADPPTAFWEAWSILAGLAVATTIPRLGTLVACAGYRNPALLAKIVDTVDEMSGGRVILGIGAGDHWGEHERYGLAWEQPMGRFEEALQIIVPLLRDGRVDFDGRHHHARGAVLIPRGTRANGPPILIGALGTGPRMLRLVTQYADLWNGWFVFRSADPGDDIESALARVEAACELHGRDPVSLGKTIGLSIGLNGAPASGGSLVGPASAIADRLRRFAELGIQHVQLVLAPSGQPGIEAFAEVLDLLDAGR